MSETMQSVPIDAERIRKLVPHAGNMCLLERVVACDAASIRCETRSHLDQSNPLRRNGQLASICAIEYAAQAMALHGALTAPGLNGALTAPGDNGALTVPGHIGALTAPGHSGTLTAAASGNTPADVRHGYLASVRDLRCRTRCLDQYTGTLSVSATLVFDESARRIYSFVVAAGKTELVTGRAAVILA